MKKILPVTLMLAGLTIPQGAKASTIVNSLGQASPNTKFSIFGSGGLAITDYQLAGPKFVLTQPTIITEIGGFVNNCGTIILGQPDCPDTLPFTVQIHPAVNGVPDAFNTIGSFILSDDRNPLTVSYEFASPNLLLEPGIYFALFAPQGLDAGFLLDNTSNPPYTGELVPIGILNFSNNSASVDRRTSAVRILGKSTSVPEPSAVLGLGLFVAGLTRSKQLKEKIKNQLAAVLEI